MRGDGGNLKLRPRPPELAHRAEGVTDTVGNGDPAAAAAMLPAELLQPGEIIILMLKPSPWFIVLAPLKTILLLALATAAAALLPLEAMSLAVPRQQVVLLGAALIGLRLFWQFLEWLSRIYVLTDQRVIRVMGVLRISVFEAPLQQVQHTNLLFAIRERLLGLGSIGFATAGTGGFEAYWQTIARPYEVHQKVVQTLRRYRR